jgi:predicted phosphate transport protein (TIGR00153 family)
LVPTDEGFFDLFDQSAANALEAANRLHAMISDFRDLATGHKGVIECEHQGDELTRSIIGRLSTSFVTPFDREDIHALAEKLDDVVDDMLAVSDLLNLVHVEAPLPEFVEQADVLVRSCEEMVLLMAEFRRMKGVEPHLERIDKLESEGDAINRRALGHLFDGEFKALDVLKWKDIVQAMELAINTVEDISNVVEAVVVKHA